MSPDLIVPTLILFIALIFDVKTRKIPNHFVIVAIVLALISNYYFFGFEGLKQGSLAAGLAIIMTLPLVLIGALGAGDMKLMFAVGFAVTYSAVFSIMIFSFVWASIFGVSLAVVSGRGKQMLQNIYQIVMTRTSDATQLQRIPYTVPLFLGWLTYLYFDLRQVGGFF